jgi:outer membrane protein assembly factor BamB
MKKSGPIAPWIPVVVLAAAALGVLALWVWNGMRLGLPMRVPGTDQAPGAESGSQANPVLAGKLVRGTGAASDLPGAWPQFRGPERDGIGKEKSKLLRTWQPSEPRELWGMEVGEGYAGVSVLNGRAYLMDYDREKKQDALRCLSLADGAEIWRYAYPVAVKRNHGMTRTVPAVTAKILVAMGPKCHVTCLDPATGDLRWGLDLVRQHGATVPPWYAGQCPLIDNGKVILAPGGKGCLVMAVEGETGKVLWQTPNPHGWKMTHSSLMTMEFAGERTYIYCADKGVVGVSARDGKILWETKEWKISIATVPSPLVVGGDRIFLSGGYNAGSMMLRLKKNGDEVTPEVLFRLPPEVFGATQQTPVLSEDHIYGIRADGRLTCLDLEGKPVWTSDSRHQFGLGPFMLADGLILAMNDSGLLKLFEASSARCSPLAQAQVLKGRESWGPMALAGNRLLVRDLTRLVCLEVGR